MVCVLWQPMKTGLNDVVFYAVMSAAHTIPVTVKTWCIWVMLQLFYHQL